MADKISTIFIITLTDENGKEYNYFSFNEKKTQEFMASVSFNRIPETEVKSINGILLDE